LGELAWQPGSRIYLDTNLFIYAVEEIAPYAEQVRPLLEAADRGEIRLVTSLLALAETLVLPHRMGDEALIMTYRGLFTRPPRGLSVARLDAAQPESAACLRAKADALRPPDAIHLATAESEQCDLFVTNDKRLRASTALPVVVLAEILDEQTSSEPPQS
jgi:predicted nucleic acid-binding protein